jgi:threonine aldolase
MRFLAAPWVGVLRDGAWLRHARRANDMAALLEDELAAVPGLSIVHPRQVNSVFVKMPEPMAAAVRAEGWRFYDFIGGAARLMCAWDTTAEDVKAFVAALAKAAAAR